MNRALSLTLSIVLHFFILKTWVFIIDSGSIPERHKIDIVDTTLNLNSFLENPRRKSNSLNPTESKAILKSNTKRVVEDIGPLLSKKDLETDKNYFSQSKSQNFQINNHIPNDTFQIRDERKIIEEPLMNKKIHSINNSRKSSSRVSKKYNIDEGINNSKIEYFKEDDGALVEASSRLENAFWIKKPEFSYPKLAEKEGIEGTVKLKVTINTSGTIIKAILSKKTHPILDEAALRDIYKGKIGAINNKSKSRISAEVIVTVPYRFGK